MKNSLIRLEAILLLVSVWFTSVACITINQPANSVASDGNQAAGPASNTASTANNAVAAVTLNDDELDQLLAPIALYPDPLLAQMIPAATYVEQIQEAQRMMNGSTDDNIIAKQDWDVSVKSVAHYPPVLKMMASDEDWTTTLGQVYVNQPKELNASIQRLRSEAANEGNLVTTPQQEVIVKDEIITIEPAQPEVIYVPQYDPETVYVEEVHHDEGVSTGTAVAIGALAFGAGLAIGSWLNRDYDYYGYYGPPGPYYHGWNGGGWVGANATYVNANINRNVYVNDSYRNISTNRNVVNRNISGNYRNDLTRNAAVRNQRVTNARVNRQINRPDGPIGGPSGGIDRNRGDRGNNLGGNRPQPKVNSPDRDRGGVRNNDIGGNRPNAGNRNNTARSADRRSPSSPNRGGGVQHHNQGNRQQHKAAPRQQPQRSAPQRNSGGGGRRRG